jgi:hypothetical protein
MFNHYESKKVLGSSMKRTRIGILTVHGIGEQSQFEHLQEVATNFVRAIRQDETKGPLDVHVELATNTVGALGAQQQTWKGPSPIVIHVYSPLLDKKFEIYFHEAWWADIDPPSSLPKFIQFTSWGLSLWNTPNYFKRPIIGDPQKNLGLPGKNNQTGENNQNGKRKRKISWVARIEYFGIALLFIFVLPLLWVLNLVTQLFGLNLRLDVISQYLGKVRLYQKQTDAPLVDLDCPPRYTIRRRILTQMVQMASAGYDDWYILAHSMGGVVAFNALQEPDHCFPNYLDHPTWNLAWANRLTKVAKDSSEHAPTGMNLTRPPWLKPEDLIDREALFKDLKGVVTYGAPLKRFADLWPDKMLLNKNNPFSQDCKWYNVYDPFDPVGTESKELYPDNFKGNKPEDVLYQADGPHLIAHTTYLCPNQKDSPTLIAQLVKWMLWSTTPLVPDTGKRWCFKPCHGCFDRKCRKWCRKRRRQASSWLAWGFLWVLSVVIFSHVVIFSGVIPIIENLEKHVRFLGLISFLWNWNLLGGAWDLSLKLGVSAIVIVFLTGFLRCFFGRPDPRQDILEFLRNQANKPFTLQEIFNQFDYTDRKIYDALNALVKERKIQFDPQQYMYIQYRLYLIESALTKFSNNQDDRYKQAFVEAIISENGFGTDSLTHQKQPSKDLWSGKISLKYLNGVMEVFVFYYILDRSPDTKEVCIFDMIDI